MVENELSKMVVDICFKIHKSYGPGLLESVYEEMICYELEQLNILYKRQYGFKVWYKGVDMWGLALEQILL